MRMEHKERGLGVSGSLVAVVDCGMLKGKMGGLRGRRGREERRWTLG